MARKVIALPVLFSLALAVFPIPLIRLSTKSVSSVPFPCQSCHCGCDTAENCWTNCCCFSPVERLIWANDHGVKPPSYAILIEPSETSDSVHTCCVSRTTTSTNLNTSPRITIVSQAEINRSINQDTTTQITDKKQEGNEVTPALVLSIRALKCQGKTSDFIAFPWSLIGISFRRMNVQALLIGQLLLADFSCPSASYSPDPQPPKR